jgi:hypothetical protein
MATNLVEVSNWDAAVPVYDDGDAVNAAAGVALAQPLANRLQFLRTLLNGSFQPFALGNVVQTNGSVHQTLTSALLANITAMQFNLTLNVGEFVIAVASLEWSSVTASIQNTLNLSMELGGQAFSVQADSIDAAAGNPPTTTTVSGLITEATGGVRSLQMRGSISTPNADLRNFAMTAIAFKPIVIP